MRHEIEKGLRAVHLNLSLVMAAGNPNIKCQAVSGLWQLAVLTRLASDKTKYIRKHTNPPLQGLLNPDLVETNILGLARPRAASFGSCPPGLSKCQNLKKGVTK